MYPNWDIYAVIIYGFITFNSYNNYQNGIMKMNNYMQVVDTTDEEKLKMYMKCKKKYLAKMLIEANRILYEQKIPTVRNSGTWQEPIVATTTSPMD